MVPLILALQPAAAHDIRPGTILLTETAPATYTVHATPAQDGGLAVHLRPSWPADCQTFDQGVSCAHPLDGPLPLLGPDGRHIKVVAVRHHLDGTRHVDVLEEGEHIVQFGPPDATELLGVGVAHVATGWDHIAFITGLVLLCRQARALVLAVTGFTVGHAAALVLATAGVQAPAQAVEIWIALSVVLVAREALGDRPSLSRKQPVLVSSGLGLVHGLGFANALGALAPLPEARTLGLFVLNLGIELAQLAIVLPLALVVPRLPDGARTGAAWSLGGLGMYWLLQRTLGG